MQLRARARRCFLCRGSHAAPISDLHVSTFSYELDLLRGRGVLLPSLLGPTLTYYLATSCRCPPSALARSCSSFPLSADLSGVDLDTPLPLEIVRVRDCRVLGLLRLTTLMVLLRNGRTVFSHTCGGQCAC